MTRITRYRRRHKSFSTTKRRGKTRGISKRYNHTKHKKRSRRKTRRGRQRGGVGGFLSRRRQRRQRAAYAALNDELKKEANAAAEEERENEDFGTEDHEAQKKEHLDRVMKQSTAEGRSFAQNTNAVRRKERLGFLSRRRQRAAYAALNDELKKEANAAAEEERENEDFGTEDHEAQKKEHLDRVMKQSTAEGRSFAQNTNAVRRKERLG